MKQRNKLMGQEQQEQTQHIGQVNNAPLDFASPEELLRHDASQVVVPPVVAQRLEESARDLPAPKLPWWKRIFN